MRSLVFQGLLTAALLGLLGAAKAGPILRTVDSAGFVGLTPSVQINGAGFPVISYYDGGNGDLKLAVCGDALCTTATITTVDSAGLVGMYSSLKLDASGFPVISYADLLNEDLKVAVCGDALCTTSTITTLDSIGNVGQYTSLQLNANGFPVISYADFTNNDLKVAVCGDANCTTRTITTVDSPGFVGTANSLQLDASGFPVISYADGTNADLKLAVCADATCSTGVITTVDSLGVVGVHPSLQFNASGFPIISYGDSTNGSLKLAACSDPICSVPAITTLDSGGVVGLNTSLQLDGSGFPVISHYDSTNQNLKLVVCNDATCTAPVITTLDSAGDVGLYTSLTLDASGLPVIGYFNATNGDLKLAMFVRATVSSVTVPANGTYVAGQNLDFTVNWSENVVVTGTPQIALTLGVAALSATYVSGSGTSALLFRYTVAAGNLDTDGITVGALSLNGGTIRDAYGFDATLTLNSVGSTAAVLVDAAPPAVTSVTVPANGTYVSGQNLDFTVNWNENVTVTGTPQIALTIGAATRNATYVSGGGTNALTFNYTVVAADVDNDGIAVSALSLSGGTIRDAAGNDAVLTLNAVGVTTGVLVNPAVKTYTAPSATGTGNITATFTGGGAGCTFTTSQFIPLTGHPASPPAGSAPSYPFVHGLFDFRLGNCTPGSTITMTITYPAVLAANTRYYKYGPTPGPVAAHWYQLPAAIAGNTISFTITDGALGDDDLLPDGVIIDQGGPAVPAPAPFGPGTGVPTLSEWMLALLAALMLLAGARRVRET